MTNEKLTSSDWVVIVSTIVPLLAAVVAVGLLIVLLEIIV